MGGPEGQFVGGFGLIGRGRDLERWTIGLFDLVFRGPDAEAAVGGEAARRGDGDPGHDPPFGHHIEALLSGHLILAAVETVGADGPGHAQVEQSHRLAFRHPDPKLAPALRRQRRHRRAGRERQGGREAGKQGDRTSHDPTLGAH